MVRFLRIDPMVSCSNPPLAKLSPGEKRVLALGDFKRRNHAVWSQ